MAIRGLILGLLVASSAVSVEAWAQPVPGEVPIVDELDAEPPAPPEDPEPEEGFIEDPEAEPAVPAPRLVLVEPESPSPVTEERLRAHLEVRAAALRSGDEAGAELALGLLEEARDALGTPNAIFAAVVLVEEAQEARAAGASEPALERARRALRLAPDLLAAHWLHIQLLIDQDATRLARISQAVLQMGAAWLRSFRNQVHLGTILVGLLLLAVVSTFTVVGAAFLGRHLPYQAHDLSRGLPRVIGSGEMTLLMLLGILLPGALGLGWPASIALGLGVTLAYQTSTERSLSVLGVLLVAGAPWLAGAAAPLVAFHGSRVDHLAAVLEEALAEPSETALRAHLNEQPDDGLVHLVLGVRAALRDDLATAEDQLTAAKRARPADVAVLNDLGVVQYRRGEHEQGERHLRAAAGRSAHQAEPHLNLSLIAAERGDFGGAERSLRAAQANDAALVKRIEAKAGIAVERRLSMIHVAPGLLWGELYRLDEAELGATRSELWQRLGGDGPIWTVPALGLLALALGLLGFRTVDRSRPCVKCGQPASSSASGGLCAQCQSVFMKTQSVSTKARHSKERQIFRRQQLVRWGHRLAALIPGLSSLLSGRTLYGFGALLLFFLALGLLLARSWLWVHAWHVPGDGTGRHLLLMGAACMAGGLSALSVWRAFGR